MTTSVPTCPRCNHEFTNDDMESAEDDLWGAAPREELVIVLCPWCEKKFFLQGGYQPEYESTAVDEFGDEPE